MNFLKIKIFFGLLAGLGGVSEVLALGESPALRARANSTREFNSPRGNYKFAITPGKSLVMTNIVTAQRIIDFGSYAKGVSFLGDIDHLMVVFYASYSSDLPTRFAVYDLIEKRFYINQVDCYEPIFMSNTKLENGRYLKFSYLMSGSFSLYDLESRRWVKHSSDLAEIHAARDARHKVYRLFGWGTLAMGVGLLLKKL